MIRVRRKDYDLWFRSAREGRFDTLSKLYDCSRIKDIDIQDFKYRTALYLATKKGHTTCAEILLHRGADPNRHSHRSTPAHAAARLGRMDLLELLVRHGASLGTRDHVMKTVLHVAGKNLTDAQVQRLVQCADKNVLMECIKRRAGKDSATRRQSGIPAPLARVCTQDLQVHESQSLARGPNSKYVMGMLRSSDVTLKMLLPERDKRVQTKLFLNEVDVASQLRHPNILQLLSVCFPPSPEQCCLVLEPVEGIFLHRLLFVEKQTLKEDTILGIGRDVASAMHYAHQRGFLHCYLGSHSVVLDANFQAKICNFEYALPLVSGNSSKIPISHCSTLYEYMAPEQLCGKAADKPGDIFSFGLMIWECVTSKTPLAEVVDFKKILKEEDPRIKQIPKKWSHSIVVLVTDCLATAEQRPTFAQIYEWLDAAVECRYVSILPSGTYLDNHLNFFPVPDKELT